MGNGVLATVPQATAPILDSTWLCENVVGPGDMRAMIPV
jgi:hypothetical protein